MEEQKNNSRDSFEGKYFIDSRKYNCPFCKVRSIYYHVVNKVQYDDTKDSIVYVYTTQCGNPDCQEVSIHYSRWSWIQYQSDTPYFYNSPDGWSDVHRDKEKYNHKNIDKLFFSHDPTSFFTLDERINERIRKCISEAERCKNINAMVGASANLRKAIYKLIKDKLTKAERMKKKGKKKVRLTYAEQIEKLKCKFDKISPDYFDAIGDVQGMTSDDVHEDKDWKPFSQKEFDFLIFVVKKLLEEIYVKPDESKKDLETMRMLKQGRTLEVKESFAQQRL